jgi:hypothetical protein
VPLSELERLACDCHLTRIVLAAHAVPLDVGQTKRTYSAALRRAVLVRDRHCQWPGCTLRASWCEVHHRIWYADGGPTSLTNAVTLCVFHHHEVHRRHTRITPVADGLAFTRPDGTHLGTTKRNTNTLQLIPAPRPPNEDGLQPSGGTPHDHRAEPSAGDAASVNHLADQELLARLTDLEAS